MKYLWDTNTGIYYLQQQFPSVAEKFIDKILRESHPSISVISEIELLCWKTPTEQELNILKSFISHSNVIELNSSIKTKTVELRKTKSIKLPDAIIAATALSQNLTLISRNAKDFKNIPNLEFINPFDLK